MHPSVQNVLQFFKFDHLPPHLQGPSKLFADMAHEVARTTSGPETVCCLRDLLRAKDCFVRACLVERLPAATG